MSAIRRAAARAGELVPQASARAKSVITRRSPRRRGRSPKRLAQRSRILGIGTTREATKVLLEESPGIRTCAPIGLEPPGSVKGVLRPGVRSPRELGVDSQGAGGVAS